jgi:DNA-binding NarL/FixJ family response regulator
MVTLTPREKSIAKAIWQGLANKEIARELGIAIPTVKNHVSAIMEKLDVKLRTQIALWFQARDLESASPQ